MRTLRSLAAAVLLGTSLGAGAIAALAEPPKSGHAPDPPPIASRKQWVFEVVARNGKATIERARAITVDKPAETARVFGRYAIELYVGRELLDRVRFNVPLAGDDPPQGNRNRLPRPRFDQGVTARLTARMADNPRAAYLLLVDRESGDSQKLSWPPEADGRLLPWKSGITEAKPGDFPDGGVRAAGIRDGGPPDSGAGQQPAPRDAGRD